MSKSKKRRYIAIVVILLFIGAYGRHRYLRSKITITGLLKDRAMSETSGMAASGISDSLFYVQNDSGDTSRFFVIDAEGKPFNTVYYNGDDKLTKGVDDCEDIAVGPGPEAGKSYIYIGDIGDNGANRPIIIVYRIEEKKSLLNGASKTAKASPIYLRYPDKPKDAETLMIDPLEKLLYIVTKRGDAVGVYTTPLNSNAGDTVTLTKRSTLSFSGIKPLKWITAGDISKDGRHILLKSYQEIYYWERKPNESIWQAMQRKPVNPNYEEERLGESIAFSADGKGFYTTSEGVFAPIFYYKTP
ncbi:hypothetical protein ACFQZS_05990 [Mucilaginibacter calamicampi]|uniref:WD40-like Beta Propeller Repeat n=1 Tax=Mucilaginibacter calamicampi TaxID=1302352 RepID=A0ABW2YVA4_9SPHI